MSHKKIRLKHYIQYKFDNLMTKGLTPMVVLLFIFALVLTFFFAIVVLITHLQSEEVKIDNLPEAYWQTFMHVLDQGTITGETGWGFRLLMILPTFAGLMFVATLLGLVSTYIQNMLTNLRKGRSYVLEKNHIVILGWSNKVFSIIDELMIANENQKHARIVVLAQKDKIEMEDEIAARIEKRGRTKVICRTGDPIDLDDLDIVNPHQAKSIIIVSKDDHKSDAEIIKCILAITNHPNIDKSKLYNIVAEIQTNNNKEIANIIGGDHLTLVISNEIIARIAVQTCLQSGLTVVYNRLLDFSGVDIYFQDIEAFYERTFKEVMFAYEDITAIGIQRINGIVLLNPKATTKIRKGDKIIFIAEDDNKLPEPVFNAPSMRDDLVVNEIKTLPNRPKKILVLGWNVKGAIIVRELDNYLLKGSEISVMSVYLEQAQKEVEEIMPLVNASIQFIVGDVTSRKTVNDLDLSGFDHIMILSYSEKMGVQEADSNTLVTLMHLRDIKEKTGANFTIVSEMLNIKNRTLAEIAKPDDFIISDHVISLIVGQLAENRELKMVFDEMFDSQGMEFYLKPIELYLNNLEEPCNFYTVIEAGLRREEVAIGYRLQRFADNSQKHYGVTLNPKKSENIHFSPEDKVIVLALDY
jgi:ion channel POLLUX/CASTOR